MKPIIFNTEIVRAILDGRKTVTRRVVKFLNGFNPKWTGYVPDGAVLYGDNNIPAAKPPYRPGDILYVRETWRCMFAKLDPDGLGYEVKFRNGQHVKFRFETQERANKWMKYALELMELWHPSIHMPREAARIFLRVTNVRVERLQDINEGEAKKEGFVNDIDLIGGTGKSAARHFADLWDSTIKKSDIDKYSWEANPWVWVIEFERVSKGGEINAIIKLYD